MSDDDEVAAKPAEPKVIEQGIKQPEQQTGTKVG
jgi:hypothetical protein